MVELIIGGLATWRISHALVKEDGPLMLFTRLRASLAARQTRSGGLFDMISCVFCISMWVGLFLALFVAQGVFSWIFYGLAFSGIAVLLENINSFLLVTRPASNTKVRVSARSTSE